MPRITEYTASSAAQGKIALADTEVFAVDGVNGVRKINANKLAEALAEKTLHNAVSIGDGYGKSGIYRGADLGSGATFAEASTPAQRAAIQNGTFDGLFIGDYWTINNRVYRIADFNYWKYTGDVAYTKNHIVMLSDSTFGSEPMNDTNTTVGAYVGCKQYSNSSSGLNVARATIAEQFGSYLVVHREYLPNAVTDGAQSAGAWFDSTVELMNENMVFGAPIVQRKYAKAYIPTIDKTQLAIFKLNCARIDPARHGFWLRDVVDNTHFVYARYQGMPAPGNPSGNSPICPVFAVKGTTD